MKLRGQTKPVDDVVDPDWLCHNARQLIKMLPGGFDIVGEYFRHLGYPYIE